MLLKSQTGKENGRIVWLDALKGFLILFVLLSHSYPPIEYRRFFTPFFLTLFFFASGYTFSVRDRFPVFFVKKCRRLVLPLFLLGGIRMFAYIVLYDGGKRLTMLRERTVGLLLQRSGVYDEMWFISCLFVSCLLFYGILKAAARLCRNSTSAAAEDCVILLLSFCCLLLGFLIVYVLHTKLPWEAELALIMTHYTALGYLYRKRESAVDTLCAADTWYKALLLFLSIFVYLMAVPFLGDEIDIHMEQFAYPLLFYFLTLLITLPVIGLCKVIAGTRLKGIFSFLGQNTLFYFAFGGFVRILFYAVTDRLGLSNEYVLSVLCTLFTAALLAGPAHFVHLYMPWLIGLPGRKE